jgi:hypothetical protein
MLSQQAIGACKQNFHSSKLRKPAHLSTQSYELVAFTYF